MKAFLERNMPYFSWLGGLGIPLAVLAAGWLITTSIETSKLDAEYVKMALTILSNQRKDTEGKVLPPTKDELALRRWAIRLLNKQSPEKFSPDEQTALINASTPLISPEVMEALQRAAIRAGIDLLIGKPVPPSSGDGSAQPKSK